MSKSAIKVGIVDDHALFRRGLRNILSNWKEIEVIFEASEGYSVINQLRKVDVIPDVMLVDLTLPANENVEFSGREVTLALKKYFPEIKVIILSGHDEENFITELIECGANGYLVKDSDPDEVFEAVSIAFHKGSYINSRALKAIQNNMNKKISGSKSSNLVVEDLTTREIEILQLICMQLTTEEMAVKLNISPKTVNGHRNKLLQKTGAQNVAGLVLHAVKYGYVKVN